MQGYLCPREGASRTRIPASVGSVGDYTKSSVDRVLLVLAVFSIDGERLLEFRTGFVYK